MTLAWKRTLAEWARFSKAVTSGEKERERERRRTYPACLSADMLLSFHHVTCSSVLSSDMHEGQQGTEEIRFGANRSRCFLKRGNMRRDSDCQRYWVYERAYLSRREKYRWIYWMQVLTCRWRRYNSIVFAVQLVRKCATSVPSPCLLPACPSFSLSLSLSPSFLVPFHHKRMYQAYSPALLDNYM